VRPRACVHRAARGESLRAMELGCLLLAGWLVSAAPAPEPFTVPARRGDLEDLRAMGFDPRWILPDRVRGASPTGRVDLTVELERAAARPLADGLRLGDLVLEHRARATAAERARFLAELPDRLGPSERRLTAWLPELLRDGRLADGRWDPAEDAPDDGLLLVEPWDVSREGEPWRSVRGNQRVQQSAALLFADVATIKEVENDYRLYPSNVGADYEAIHPVQGSYLRGATPSGRPFAASRLFFEVDLPFPFSSYACDMWIYNELDGRGRLVCHIQSASDDFHWFAGRDVFVPLEASDGRFAGTLVVRVFGFDLDGVPDGDSHRREALRAGLGNLKRNAEAAFARRGGEPRPLGDDVPAYAVRGER